jgi:hypothetical protein
LNVTTAGSGKVYHLKASNAKIVGAAIPPNILDKPVPPGMRIVYRQIASHFTGEVSEAVTLHPPYGYELANVIDRLCAKFGSTYFTFGNVETGYAAANPLVYIGYYPSFRSVNPIQMKWSKQSVSLTVNKDGGGKDYGWISSLSIKMDELVPLPSLWKFIKVKETAVPLFELDVELNLNVMYILSCPLVEDITFVDERSGTLDRGVILIQRRGFKRPFVRRLRKNIYTDRLPFKLYPLIDKEYTTFSLKSLNCSGILIIET